MQEVQMPLYDPQFGGLVARPITVRFVHVVDHKVYPFSKNVRFSLAYFFDQGIAYASWAFCNPKDSFVKAVGRDNATLRLYTGIMEEKYDEFLMMSGPMVAKYLDLERFFKPESVLKFKVEDFKHEHIGEALKRDLFARIKENMVKVPSWLTTHSI